MLKNNFCTNSYFFIQIEIFLDAYVFSRENNKISIVGGALKYIPGIKYNFKISTSYLDYNYVQMMSVKVVDVPGIPFAILKCRFMEQCFVDTSYRKININNKLIIDGGCKTGCESSEYIEHSFKISYALEYSNSTIWYEYQDDFGDIIGKFI